MIIVEKVSISDNDVGYNSKTEGHTTFMSDINKLYEIRLRFSQIASLYMESYIKL